MKTGFKECHLCREHILTRICEEEDPAVAREVETHLADCPECRRYAVQLRATASGLSSLVSDDVQPSAGFRNRWRREVREAAQPPGMTEWPGQLLEYARLLLRRNRRPLLALAPVWLLVLFFRTATPQTALPAPGAVARSPVEIVHALKAQEPILGVLSPPRNPSLDLPPRLVTPPGGATHPSESPDLRGNHSSSPRTQGPICLSARPRFAPGNA